MTAIAGEAVFCRALPVDSGERLAVFRCTLRLENGAARIAVVRLSPAKQDCRMPAWVPGRGAVYEAVASDGARGLWLADESGAMPLPGARKASTECHQKWWPE